MKKQKIAIIGLGYVGLPLAVEFSKKYNVIGFDIVASRISELKENIDRTLEIKSSELQKYSNLKSSIANKNEAEKLDKILQPLHHAMFVESNPSPVKYAAKQLGLCDDAVRLPLVRVTDNTKDIVNKALKIAKLV